MGERHGFFDKDVFIKLACCDLWEDVLEVLGVTHPYRLASATAKGSKAALLRKNIGADCEETLQRLKRMERHALVIAEPKTEEALELYNRLITTSDIDSGEAQLVVAVLACEQDKKLISGDKRFLRAMLEKFPDELTVLCPSIVTFEQCVLAVCDTKGFEHVRNRLWIARACDGSLRHALGSHGGTSYLSFKEGLVSFGAMVPVLGGESCA